GNDPDVAHDHGAAADGGATDRLLAALDAVDEVLHVIGRPAVVDLRVVLERLREDLGVAGEERVAADEDRAGLPLDEHAVPAGADGAVRRLAVLVDQVLGGRAAAA